VGLRVRGPVRASIFNPGVNPNLSTDLLILENRGPTAPFTITIPNPFVSEFDFPDIEHGDWREIGSLGGFTRFFELDFGCALTRATAQLTTLDHDGAMDSPFLAPHTVRPCAGPVRPAARAGRVAPQGRRHRAAERGRLGTELPEETWRCEPPRPIVD